MYASLEIEITFAAACVGVGAETNGPLEFTVNDPAASIPFNFAVMVAVPADNTDTLPAASTEATDGFDDVNSK